MLQTRDDFLASAASTNQLLQFFVVPAAVRSWARRRPSSPGSATASLRADAQKSSGFAQLFALRVDDDKLVSSRRCGNCDRRCCSSRLSHAGPFDKGRRPCQGEPHRVSGVTAAPDGKRGGPFGSRTTCREHVVLDGHHTARYQAPVLILNP